MSLTPKDILRIEDMESRGISIIDNLDLLLPEDIPLDFLSGVCNKSRDTLRKYLVRNYVDGEGYHQKVKGGKLYVARAAALEIRRHYVR